MTKPRRPWWKKLLLFAAFALVAVITIAALALSWISFQARRDWAKTKADLLARGEKLSLAELIPAAIPDDRNFFGDPMWAELTDFVPGVDGNGNPARKLRVPKEQRKIEAIDPAPPVETLERARAIFSPGELSGVNSKTGVPLAMRVISRMKTADPATQRQLAQLALDALAPGKPACEHIASLLDRPGAVCPRDYSGNPFTIPIEEISYQMKLGQIWNASAQAHLALGDPAAAARDVTRSLRLAGTLSTDPFLICLLVRISILTMATRNIDHGIADHQWNDTALAAFENELASVDLPVQLAVALRSERAGINHLIELVSKNDREVNRTVADMIHLQPQESSYSPDFPMPLPLYRFLLGTDQGRYNRFLQQYLDALGKPDGLRPGDLPVPENGGPVYSLFHFLTMVTGGNHIPVINRTLYFQDTLSETRIACALERHRLQNGAWPATLGDLVPAFIGAIPPDVIAGQKFHYRLDGPDKFRLWAAGWNETDEGGARSLNRQDYQTADWVWNEPPGPKR